MPPTTRPVTDHFDPPQAAGEVGRFGKYRVLRQLGEGGMGLVFLAEDGVLGRSVALKFMAPRLAADPAARERFVREARSAAGIRSEHVVGVYDVNDLAGVPYIAMERLKGQSLEDFVENKGLPALPQAVRIGREAALGLAAAHAAGLVHRDIKPANVWLEAPKGKVRLIDFGLAYEERQDTRLTVSGQLVGTPEYMAPEQAAGKPVDGRADLFSLGVTLYRLVTGRRPFARGSVMASLAAVLTETPPPPGAVNPQVPPGLSDLIARLMAKDPAARPPTADAVVQALEWAAAELARPQPTPASVVTPAAAPGPPPSWPMPVSDHAVPTFAPAADGEGGPFAPTRRRPRGSNPALPLAVLGSVAAAGSILAVLFVLGVIGGPPPAGPVAKATPAPEPPPPTTRPKPPPPATTPATAPRPSPKAAPEPAPPPTPPAPPPPDPALPAPTPPSAWQVAGEPFAHRFGPLKAKLLAETGGTVETEAAVARGLDWLGRRQRADGSWVFDGTAKTETTAATGLAVLAFLGAGETHTAGRYKTTVDRGVKYLTGCLQANGRFRNAASMYGHAIGALALCEAYGMTRDRPLLTPAQRAVDGIISAQGPNGSWGYQPNTNGDTSIVGWQLQVLDAAGRNPDLVVPPNVVRRAVGFLDSVAGGPRKSTYGYTTGPGMAGTSLTAVGLLSRYNLDGWTPANAGFADGVQGLVSLKPPRPGVTPDMYYLYYASWAVRMRGGDEWHKQWNPALRALLTGLQEPAGSWAPDAGFVGPQCGRTGTTALTVLTLETYYRYPPRHPWR